MYIATRDERESLFLYHTRAYQNSNIKMKYSFRNEGMQYLLKLRSCPFIDITYVYEQSYNCIIVQNGLFYGYSNRFLMSHFHDEQVIKWLYFSFFLNIYSIMQADK